MAALATRPRFEDARVEEVDGRESGTRRVASRRDSQRPTIPVPGTASLAGYLASPPRIQNIAVETGRTPRVAIQMQAVALEQNDKPTVIPPRGRYQEDAPE